MKTELARRNFQLWHKQPTPAAHGATRSSTIEAATTGAVGREAASARAGRREVPAVGCPATETLKMSWRMRCCVGKWNAAPAKAAPVEGVRVDCLDWDLGFLWRGRDDCAECRDR